MAATLFAVFCATAVATLWLAESHRTPAVQRAEPAGERLTDEERDALEKVLEDQNPARQP